MAIGQICYNILTSSSGTVTIPAGTNIYNNIVPANSTITKLSITAQPGVKALINGSKEIMIGRTGVYEVEGVEITSLKIIQPVEQNVDEVASRNARMTGIAGIKNALVALAAIDLGSDDGSQKNDETKSKVGQIKSLAADLTTNCNNYVNGYNGIYEDGDPIDLMNVIIDYIYE